MKESFCPAFSCAREYVSSATNDGIYQLSNVGRLSQIRGDETYDPVGGLRLPCNRNRKDSDDVTYYRVEFLPAQPVLRPAKRFRTEDKAKKHARRVLGVADDGDLATRVTIVAVSRNGTPV